MSSFERFIAYLDGRAMGLILVYAQKGIYSAWKQICGLSSIVERVAGASTMLFFELAAIVGFHVYTHVFAEEAITRPPFTFHFVLILVP
jgi:hypothetical protein